MKQADIHQLVIQTAFTFVAAALGAIFGAFLTRWTDRHKQRQVLRTTAYVDFLRSVAALAIARRDTLKNEQTFAELRAATLALADAKARIAIYGSKDVVRSVAAFMRSGAVLDTSGEAKFAELCMAMRNEDSIWSQRAKFEDVAKLLFD